MCINPYAPSKEIQSKIIPIEDEDWIDQEKNVILVGESFNNQNADGT
jgi:hypothetical protein